MKELEKDKLELYSSKYNRSKLQCNFLFDLLYGQEELYLELEDALKYLMVFYCPSTMAECYYLVAKYRVYKELKLNLF